MFTGIIKTQSRINDLTINNTDAKLVIYSELDLESEIGDSIACNGICLTLVKKENKYYYFDIALNTIEKTTVKYWQKGLIINIETALRAGDQIGGHYVLGHVDGMAEVISLDQQGESLLIWIELPIGYDKFLANLGSITIDGISLTVTELNGNRLRLCIIPHTVDQTNIKFYSIGTKVNFEVDYFARQIVSFLDKFNNSYKS